MHHKSKDNIEAAIEPLVDALALPSFIVDLDRVVVHANDRARALISRADIETVVGSDIETLFAEGQMEGLFDRLDASTITANLSSITLIGCRSEIYQYSVSILKDEQGSVFRYLFQCLSAETLSEALMTAQNTDQQHIENYGETQLAQDPSRPSVNTVDTVPGTENEWRWKTAVLSANHAVWDHDFEKDRHFVSDTWRELRGLDPNDPIPNSTSEWLTTIHPHDIEDVRNEVRRLEANETDIINYKFRQKHTKGHWVWFLSSGRVVRRDKDGGLARIMGTDTDITDIKTVELERHRMADRLNIAMEAAGMARWEFDVSANYAYWDDQMLENFGITDGINIRSSKAWASYIHPDDREEVLALAADCLKKEQDIACDYRHLRYDGTVRHIRTRGKYVKDQLNGARYYGVNFDVTRDYQRAEELENARAQLEHESRHDALTGLANRRCLDEEFTKQTQNPDHAHLRPAILHFDIDYFKQINDTLGHDAGDMALKHAAEILQKNLPADALVSRVGGDEFAALLFNAPPAEELEEIATSIISEMAQPFYYGSQQCKTGTSIGIAVAEDKEALDSELFINADLALYAAKKAGRGRFKFFTSEMKIEARRRKNSFDALLAGFDNGEITCHYQPQFDAQTLQLSGLEALVRWESKKFGLIMPDEFLSTAEDMRLVAHFDELVLRKALYDLDEWQAQGFDIPRVSVNVSSHRLNDPTLIEQLKPLNLPEGKLSFELLESAFLDSKNEVIEHNLKQIEQMGIEIEIDDFGSGHASIVSLLQVAPKRLKIDRFLIEPIVTSKRQRDLIKTIVGIGKMLDIRVVAEGVETWEHVKVLREIGCCYLQGYGLARPMAAQDISPFMQKLCDNGGCLAAG